MPLQPSRPRSFVRRIGAERHRQRFFQLYDLTQRPLVVHERCDCNQLIAIRNRVQQRIDPVLPQRLAELRQVARAVATVIGPLEPADYTWITCYGGRKYRRYARAVASLTVSPLTRSDRVVSAFVKPEKLEIDEPKDPRMIQCRSARFNVEFGRFTRVLEARFYALRGQGPLRRWMPRDAWIAKGHNMRKRARVILGKFRRFGVCWSLDLSRFDAHVSQDLLRVGHLVYLRCFRNDRLLRRLLAWQLENSCYSSCWHYNSVGGRMSGDMDTALGNCLLMLMLVCVAMRALGLTPDQWTCYIDGDDCLLFTRANVSELVPIFAELGQVLKLEQVAYTYHTIQHCQARPVWSVDGPIMVQHPLRVINRSLAGVRHWGSRRFWPRYVGWLGDCELALGSGVPIVQEFALMLRRWSQGRRPRSEVYSERTAKVARELRDRPLRARDVTSYARATLAEAWGIEVDEQLAMESMLRLMPPPWDSFSSEY